MAKKREIVKLLFLLLHILSLLQCLQKLQHLNVKSKLDKLSFEIEHGEFHNCPFQCRELSNNAAIWSSQEVKNDTFAQYLFETTHDLKKKKMCFWSASCKNPFPKAFLKQMAFHILYFFITITWWRQRWRLNRVIMQLHCCHSLRLRT